MTVFECFRNGGCVLSVLWVTACQPPLPANEKTAKNSDGVEASITMVDDEVTLSADHILSMKPSRYQPSLGLQGNIDPIQQTQFVAVRPITVEKVLVSENQWVEKGEPLLIVQRLLAKEQTVQTSPTLTDVTAEVETTDTATTDTVTTDTATTNETQAGDPISEPQTSNAVSPSRPDALISVSASFSGRVEALYVEAGQRLAAQSTLLRFSDETKPHFIATLPIQAEPQLSVGQTVNFTADNMLEQFTGQISKLTKTGQPPILQVKVDVIDNKLSRTKLLPNMKVTGRVNYGQIDVGTIVPKRALHDVDLTELHLPPFKPLVPLAAHVWIIGQDQRLRRHPIEVVEYNPATEQYLIAGISNDSLICLADLPIEAAGKKVNVS